MIALAQCLQPRDALSRFPPVHRANFDRVLRVELTRSPNGSAMAAICAFETFEATSRIDVERPLRIAAEIGQSALST